MEIPFQILDNDETILGMIHTPKQRASGSPVLLICYGLGGNRSEVHRMSVTLGRMADRFGVTVVRFDYTGSGMSEGEFSDSSLRTKTNNALAVIHFLRGCFKEKQFSLILLGFSDGAQVVNHLCQQQHLDISGVIFWNPILFPVKNFHNHHHQNQFQRDPLTRKIAVPYYGLFLGMEYLGELKKGIHMDGLKDAGAEFLFIFGEIDHLTNEFKNYILSDWDHRNATVEIIKNAGHLFNNSEMESEVITKSLAWCEKIGS